MENIPPNDFGKVPQDAAAFGKMPQGAADFGNVPKVSERKENHTLTVREVSRLFEAAGVGRSERSIVNWCQPNALGAAKLDAYFDPNERKYFITPESVNVAITEEQAKAKRHTPEAEGFGKLPHVTEAARPVAAGESPADIGKLKTLEAELFDLKITNRGKDYLIEQMQKERNVFFDQLLTANRKVGELETKLLQIEAPSDLPRDIG